MSRRVTKDILIQDCAGCDDHMYVQPDPDTEAVASRTKYNWASTSQTMLGVKDRAKALPDATTIPKWKHTDDDPRHPSQAQLDTLQESDEH